MPVVLCFLHLALLELTVNRLPGRSPEPLCDLQTFFNDLFTGMQIYLFFGLGAKSKEHKMVI